MSGMKQLSPGGSLKTRRRCERSSAGRVYTGVWAGFELPDAPSNLSGGASKFNLYAAGSAARASDTQPGMRERQELLAGPGVVPEDATQRRGDRARVLLLHAAHHHAEVVGL